MSFFITDMYAQRVYEFSNFRIEESLEPAWFPEYVSPGWFRNNSNGIPEIEKGTRIFLEDRVWTARGYKCTLTDGRGNKVEGCYKELQNMWTPIRVYHFSRALKWYGSNCKDFYIYDDCKALSKTGQSYICSVFFCTGGDFCEVTSRNLNAYGKPVLKTMEAEPIRRIK